MEKVRFGIIGIGNMGSGHLRNLISNKIKNGICTAIADINPEKLENAKKIIDDNNPYAAGSINFYNSGDELIAAKTCDVVIVAIPHYFHPEYAIKAMKNGLNAIVEKPAGVYTLQVDEMLEEAKKHPELKLGVMFNQRTNPAFNLMKKMISDGELGEIKRLNWIITNWYRSQCYYNSGGWRATWEGEGGGVLYNQAPHNIDLFQWIPNMMPNKVRAFCQFGKWHDIEVEDDVTAYFEYPNGATGVFITTTADAPGTNRFEITGDKGTLLYDNGKLIFKKLDTPISKHLVETTNTFGAPNCEVIELSPEGENSQHVGILNNFANNLLGLEELIAPAADGIKGVTLANAMLLSTWTDSTVDLPIDGKKFYELLQDHVKNSKVKKTVVSGASADLSSTYNN
jgi:predicted dehydrogenase